MSLFLRTKPNRGVDTVRAARRDKTLVVNAAIGFTSYFLLSRLGGFQIRHPEINLEIVTHDQNNGFDPTQSDIIIFLGKDGFLGSASKPIFQEEMVAVCAPEMLNNADVFDLPQFARQRLLHMSSSEHIHDWDRLFADGGLMLAPP